MKQEPVKIPQATTKRLPLYYRFIQNFSNAGKKRVSSQELSDAMKIDPATIRRDFSHFGALGKKGYGYDVQHLLTFFRQTLDQDEDTKVALIGVGSLGTAFLKYNFHKNHNTRIVVAFDTSADEIGTIMTDIPIFNPSELEKKIAEYGIELVILTVPSRTAQEVTDRLISTNVKGILNFTPVRLTVPDSIRVHTIDLSVELQTLIYFIKQDEETFTQGS
jgi:redox-sensing transcriptional repressor